MIVRSLSKGIYLVWIKCRCRVGRHMACRIVGKTAVSICVMAQLVIIVQLYWVSQSFINQNGTSLSVDNTIARDTVQTAQARDRESDTFIDALTKPRDTKQTLDALEKDSYNSIDALTGSLFSGEVTRELPLRSTYSKVFETAGKDEMKDCETWAVVTTIFSLADAVRLLSKQANLCLVIVADVKSLDKDEFLEDIKRDNVKYLTVSEQYELYPLLSESIPLNSFGRKNIGYVYAIQHGAKAIWDFDDDNIGLIDISDFTSSTAYVTACGGFPHNVANPYPYFGVKDNRTWPRGFPLQYIKDASTAPNMCKTQETVKLGVVQSLAHVEPDVDAIYRLTFDIPFNFTTKKEAHPPFIVPKNVYTPFNAQAALWFPAAFKYMALPISVTGRVTDIWRSYIALHFMHKDGIQLAFSAPYVTQIRNKHENIKDFNAELDLYQRSLQLVNFLSSKEASQIENQMDMYEQLYQRNYFEEGDLKFVNAWTQTLNNI